MKLRNPLAAALAALLAGTPAMAQLGLPRVQLPDPGQVLGSVQSDIDDLTGDLAREARRLAEGRLDRIDRLVRRNREAIERDRFGEPARRGEFLVMDADAARIAHAVEAGFAVLDRTEIEGLGLSVTRLAVPPGTSLARGAAELELLLPGAIISADNLYFQSGATRLAAAAQAGSAVAQSHRVPVGVIDGAPGGAIPTASMRGFASGAPVASDHGSAITSLLRGTGVSIIHVADVYGTDPAGGNALAIARGLGWLVEQGSRVVTISLVGPDNPLLGRAIAAVQRRGVVVVAAVGNDGPGAPPAHPASYPGVVAVTAVDRHKRALIEAGRALDIDYAAPGADIYGLDRRGRLQRLRGTSFATPLVAARLSAALGKRRDWRATLDRESQDLGKRGPDPVYGRGLICAGCGLRD